MTFVGVAGAAEKPNPAKSRGNPPRAHRKPRTPARTDALTVWALGSSAEASMVSTHSVSVRVGRRRWAGAALGAAPAPLFSAAGHTDAGARPEDPAPASIEP
ncbi:hypothetical protein SRABI128_00808 [Microbacterium sp. Bi128]|nr:hypothetical protein SRABI128_00808 [Microbacterium sp. Bi128]